MKQNDIEKLRKEIEDHKDFLIETRRTLHMHPELGMEEESTAKYICGVLDSLGIEYTLRNTAISAIIKGKSEGPCVALRADIDALPIEEETGLEFSSRIPGKMHACGHDGHTAIVLGAALWFSRHREFLKGTVKLFFQPAEETVGGAETMIKNRVLENPHVDKIFGLHVMPHMKSGFIEVKKGAFNGTSTDLNIIIRGKSGHGAYPESSVDAIVIAASVITGAQTLVSRRISPLEQAVISFGVINGGTKENIIADEVTITGTLRTTDESTRDFLLERLKVMVEQTSLAHGGEGELKFYLSYPALVNDNSETERIVRTAKKLLGEGSVIWKEHPSMGVDDFSFFLKERPGAFFHIGCAPEEGTVYPLHSSRFMLNEECLTIGAAVEVALTLDVFNEERG